MLCGACHVGSCSCPVVRGVIYRACCMPRGINTANVYTCHDVACMPRRRWHAVYSMSRGMPRAVCHVACCMLHQRHLMPCTTCHASCHASQADRISLLYCRLVMPVMLIMHTQRLSSLQARARETEGEQRSASEKYARLKVGAQPFRRVPGTDARSMCAPRL